MPRKPNYRFERIERESKTAAKKPERALARGERLHWKNADQAGEVPAGDGPAGQHSPRRRTPGGGNTRGVERMAVRAVFYGRDAMAA